MDPVIRTRNLAKAHAGAGAPALRGVSLQVAPGEHVAVMGPSGSGKSTLLHLLGLLGRPSGGTYFLDGEDVAGLPPDRLSDLRCRKIGMVFQAFNLLPRSTARENVELPMIYAGIAPAERRRRAEEALERVGLARRSAAWPHQLSGGEQQRVAIARAVVNRPRVILADEPTGALDSATGATILDLFAALNAAGSTLVLVTHDREVARRAGRVLTMRDGRFLGGGDA